MTRAYSIIRQAVIDRDQITATYQGYHREMCPHAIGTKDGLEKALFYQFAGGSSSGLGPNGSGENWRCIFIEELENVSARKALGIQRLPILAGKHVSTLSMSK